MSNYIMHWGIPGMKWGVRRYRNEDGSLTDAGKRRYSKENITRSRNLVRESQNLTRDIDNLNKAMPSRRKKSKRMDLSNMSDKEMRDKINRELLERQYDQLFNDVDKSKSRTGREIVSNTLSVAGATLGVVGSSLGIALAIKELKG